MKSSCEKSGRFVATRLNSQNDKPIQNRIQFMIVSFPFHLAPTALVELFCKHIYSISIPLIQSALPKKKPQKQLQKFHLKNNSHFSAEWNTHEETKNLKPGSLSTEITANSLFSRYLWSHSVLFSFGGFHWSLRFCCEWGFRQFCWIFLNDGFSNVCILRILICVLL